MEIARKVVKYVFVLPMNAIHEDRKASKLVRERAAMRICRCAGRKLRMNECDGAKTKTEWFNLGNVAGAWEYITNMYNGGLDKNIC